MTTTTTMTSHVRPKSAVADIRERVNRSWRWPNRWSRHVIYRSKTELGGTKTWKHFEPFRLHLISPIDSADSVCELNGKAHNNDNVCVLSNAKRSNIEPLSNKTSIGGRRRVNGGVRWRPFHTEHYRWQNYRIWPVYEYIRNLRADRRHRIYCFPFTLLWLTNRAIPNGRRSTAIYIFQHTKHTL